MSKKIFNTVLISVLLVSNIILIAFVFLDGNGHIGRDHENPKKLIVEKLNFDEGQLRKYDGLIYWHRQQISKKDQHIFNLKNKLYRELGRENNTEEINDLIDSIAVIQKEVEQIHFRHFKDIKLLCRNNQLPAYNALLKEIAAIFSHRQGPPPPPPRKK